MYLAYERQIKNGNGALIMFYLLHLYVNMNEIMGNVYAG